ncbi:MAG: TraB/GumN family protein [Chromatiales bacterium]
MPKIFLLSLALSLWMPGTAAYSSCPGETAAVAKAAAASPPNTPYGQGLLFRIERARIPTSHIFGTMHLDYPRLSRLPPQVNLTLRQSRRLVMETLLDEQAQQTYTRRIYLPEGQSLAAWLDGDLYARYLKLSRWYRVPEELAPRLTPWAATNLVSRPKPSAGRTMEDVLRETAIQLGQPVFGLETIDELIDAQATMSLEDQLAVLKDTLCNHPTIMEQTEDLIALYADGNLAGILAMNEGGHDNEALSQRLSERMLYARSEQMTARLQEHLEAGSAFVAVGASHLPGERGMLRRLEKQGYSITRVF